MTDAQREFEAARADYEHRLAVAIAAEAAVDQAVTRLIAAAITAVATHGTATAPTPEGAPTP